MEIYTIALFRVIVFLSAFLLFQFELISAQKILPHFGGSYQVWLTCLVFFNLVLLLGYSTVDMILKKSLRKNHPKIHVVLLLASSYFLFAPATISSGSGIMGMYWPIFKFLAIQIGLPFYLLSMTLPLMQLWHDRLGLSDSFDLYFYSGLGSVLGLLSYPLIFNILFRLSTHWKILAVCYLLLIIFFVVVGFLLHNKNPSKQLKEKQSPGQLMWIFCSFLTCFLMLAVTNIITQMVGSIPLTWIVPLLLYLLSFMLIFKPWYSERVMSATIIMWIFASFALDLIPGVVIDQKNQLFLATFCIYLFLFIACTIINRYLYFIRPPTDTTKFNFYLNLGGLLGTILGALLIPVIGRTIAVQHLEMVSSVLLFAVFFLLRDSQKLRNHFRSRTVLKISLLSVIIFIGTYYFIKTKPSQVVYIRTLYNVMRIQDEGGVRSLVNGGVTHGKQFLDETRKKMPTLYYHPRAPFANIMNVMPHGKRNVAIIGLGIGAMAYYSRPEDQWTFFEIDADMELIARNYFTYLSDSKANLQVIIGDGRIKLKESPQLFDLLVIDAFSGDAVPAHLLTEESIGIYLQKLKSQKGPIVFHISNSFVNIESVLIPTAIKMGFTYASSDRTFTDQLGQSTSHWLILSHDAGIVKKLIDEHGWIKKPLTKYMNGWTDDYISFFQPMFLK